MNTINHILSNQVQSDGETTINLSVSAGILKPNTNQVFLKFDITRYELFVWLSFNNVNSCQLGT